MSAADRALHEEDTRILRRTRLRLMAVSGLVTLVILGALGVTVYTAVSNLIVSDSVSKLQDFAQVNVALLNETLASGGGRPPAVEHKIEQDLGTKYAGDFIIGWLQAPTGPAQRFVWTDALPTGMPVQAGLDAAGTNGSDTRDVVTSQGAPLRIYTLAGQDVLGQQYFIQTAYDRTQEINLLALLREVLVGGSLAALLLALLAGYLYAGRALVPIRQSIDRRHLALQRQREFAANASHELRTPLTVIGASVEDLKRNQRSRVADVGEALGDIDAEVRHMTALVEDLLLLARTDSGVVQVDRVPLDLSDVAVESASMLSSLGDERNVRIELDPLPAEVMGDPLRLRQLVTIFTDNAIRHSPAGSTVRVWIRPQGPVALLLVEDQGPGIREADLPRIFERFWRADNAPAGGTGLGLSIAKWIVEQHGGAIGAYNRPEGGASFWAQLPVATPAAEGETKPHSPVPAEPPVGAPTEPPADPSLLWAPGDDIENT
jgi:signal transduction histidine kinase